MARIFFPVAPAGPPAYVLPVATQTKLGGVSQGTNVNIDANGLISVAPPGNYTLPPASPTVLGGVKGAGTGLSGNVTANADGSLSAPLAQPNTYSLPLASPSVLGGVKGAGSGLVGNISTNPDGSLSAPPSSSYNLPFASPSVLGGVKGAGSGLVGNVATNSDGSLSAPVASTILYASTGQGTNGPMTQKAVSDILLVKADLVAGLIPVAEIPPRSNLSYPAGTYGSNGHVRVTIAGPASNYYKPLNLFDGGDQTYPAGWLQPDNVTLYIPGGTFLIINSMQIISTTDPAFTNFSFGIHTGLIAESSYTNNIAGKNSYTVTGNKTDMIQYSELVVKTGWATQFAFLPNLTGPGSYTYTLSYSVQIQQLF